MDSLRGSSVETGKIQRRSAWPLRKDDTHKSRSVNNFYDAEPRSSTSRASTLRMLVNIDVRGDGGSRTCTTSRMSVYFTRTHTPVCNGPTLRSTRARLLFVFLFTLLDVCVSSLPRGHANLLCIVPISADDPRRGSDQTPFLAGPEVGTGKMCRTYFKQKNIENRFEGTFWMAVRCPSKAF